MRKFKAILAVIAIWLLLADTIIVLEAISGGSPYFETLVQLFFSSWPSEWNKIIGRESIWFALGASSRLILALGTFIGVVAILERMVDRRRILMRYIDLLKLRDQTIEDIFLTRLGQQAHVPEEKFEELRTVLEGAVAEANQDLRIQLQDMFGTEEAQRIIAAQDQQIG